MKLSASYVSIWRIAKTRIFFFVIGLVLFTSLSVSVQGQDKADLELRTSFSHQHYLSRLRFWLRNDVNLRQSFGDEPQSMFFLRPRAIIELGSSVELLPGIDFRYTYNRDNASTLEIRTWQGINAHWPDIGRVMFDHLYRFEQRFHWIEGTKDEQTGLRSRYRLNMRIPLNNSTMLDKTCYMDVRCEIFLPHDDEIQELHTSRMQFGILLGYKQSSKWRYYLSGYFDTGWNTLDDSRTVNRYITEFTARVMF